jgi:hypothetical protein
MMNNKEAYEKLESERPIITLVLRRDFHKYQTAAMLSERSMISDDSAVTRQLIEKAAQYLFDNAHLVPPPEDRKVDLVAYGLTEAQRQALHDYAAPYGMTWSQFCQALADGQFWPLEPKE